MGFKIGNGSRSEVAVWRGQQVGTKQSDMAGSDTDTAGVNLQRSAGWHINYGVNELRVSKGSRHYYLGELSSFHLETYV